MSSDIPKEYCPRLCHVVRWADFDGYGFNLHAEKGKAGQFIGQVDANSPAKASGLKEGDRIVEVNGVNIGNENHKQVVTRIRQGGDETRLLVVDSESDEWFKNNKVVIKGDLSGIIFGTARQEEVPVEDEAEPEPIPEPEPEPEPEPVLEPEPVVTREEVDVVETSPEPVVNVNGFNEDDKHKPRLCHLRRWENFVGYGFNLHAERDKPGQYIGLVDDDSPAQTAGLKVNDRIVEVNGKNVEKETHTTVIEYIKEDPSETRLLVVDPEVDNYYKDRGVGVSSSMPQVLYIATPEFRDTTAELEAVADLDDLPAPPEDMVEESATKYEDIENVDAVDSKISDNDNDDIVVAVAYDVEVEPQPEPEPEPVTTDDLDDLVELSLLPEPKVESEPVPVAAEPEVEETVNGIKSHEAPSTPEPEFTIAKEPEPPVSKSVPAPEPKPQEPADDGLSFNLSAAEMRERLKAKKKQDPRHNKISFERKHQQFERM